MYTLCNENDNSYAHSVNRRPGKVILRLAPDVARTDYMYICRVCGEE